MRIGSDLYWFLLIATGSYCLNWFFFQILLIAPRNKWRHRSSIHDSIKDRLHDFRLGFTAVLLFVWLFLFVWFFGTALHWVSMDLVADWKSVEEFKKKKKKKKPNQWENGRDWTHRHPSRLDFRWDFSDKPKLFSTKYSRHLLKGLGLQKKKKKKKKKKLSEKFGFFLVATKISSRSLFKTCKFRSYITGSRIM